MIGLLAVIYLIIPESPWWLVSKGHNERARSSLAKLKKGVSGYNVDVEIAVMVNTVEQQRMRAEYKKALPWTAIFKGQNGKRLIIALWPKLTQQFVGLSVFNSYAAYFCESGRVAGSATDPKSKQQETTTLSKSRSFLRAVKSWPCSSPCLSQIDSDDDLLPYTDTWSQ